MQLKFCEQKCYINILGILNKIPAGKYNFILRKFMDYVKVSGAQEQYVVVNIAVRTDA